MYANEPLAVGRCLWRLIALVRRRQRLSARVGPESSVSADGVASSRDASASVSPLARLRRPWGLAVSARFLVRRCSESILPAA